MSAALVLEDGTVFPGESVGAEGFAFGEAVFGNPVRVQRGESPFTRRLYHPNGPPMTHDEYPLAQALRGETAGLQSCCRIAGCQPRLPDPRRRQDGFTVRLHCPRLFWTCS